MKKIFAILLLACMVLSLAACGGAKTAEYKLGMGVSLNMNSSKAGNAQVDATCAVVVLDKDGKIVACRIDVAQNKMDVTDGQVDTGKTFLTKVELGDDYNMVKYSDATHEWYEQAAAFEQYCIGKTADEIAGMETVVNEEGHTVTTDETLYASCSISIDQFQDAVVKACNDDQAATFTSDGTFTLGLAINTTAEDSTAATADEEGVVKMYSEFGAVVLDKDGKILAALTDAIQPQIKIDAAGEIGDDGKIYKGTKRELTEDYGMRGRSAIGLEWFEQAKNFTDYCVGKTAAELRATETKEDGGHTVFVDETLYASCSISVDGMIAVVAKACDNAK